MVVVFQLALSRLRALEGDGWSTGGPLGENREAGLGPPLCPRGLSWPPESSQGAVRLGSEWTQKRDSGKAGSALTLCFAQ